MLTWGFRAHGTICVPDLAVSYASQERQVRFGQPNSGNDQLVLAPVLESGPGQPQVITLLFDRYLSQKELVAERGQGGRVMILVDVRPQAGRQQHGPHRLGALVRPGCLEPRSCARECQKHRTNGAKRYGTGDNNKSGGYPPYHSQLHTSCQQESREAATRLLCKARQLAAKPARNFRQDSPISVAPGPPLLKAKNEAAPRNNPSGVPPRSYFRLHRLAVLNCFFRTQLLL